LLLHEVLFVSDADVVAVVVAAAAADGGGVIVLRDYKLHSYCFCHLPQLSLCAFGGLSRYGKAV
jgi:hypothetical protein